MNIPEEEWEKLQELTESIRMSAIKQERMLQNLNNLLHALHGEGVRQREYTSTGKPQVFQNGNWVDR